MNQYFVEIFWAATTGLLLSSTLNASSEINDCVEDLGYLPGFLLANDAGAKAHVEQYGQKHFDDALSKAIGEVKSITRAKDCQPILDLYLKSWRHGHLRVVETEQLKTKAKEKEDTGETRKPKDMAEMQPKIEFLSTETVLLTLPSFESGYRKPLVHLLNVHHEKLASASNWIIDVRENGGGSDDTYFPLLRWIMNDERAEIGMEWLVTPDNIEGQKQVCRRFMPDSQECSAWSKKAVKLMESASTGQFVREDNEAITYKRENGIEPKRPQRIGVIIDRKCASSCEQFLLTVRQSFTVKLLGRRTYGALDYSNLRPHVLPSGNYELFYATSRSLRLPHLTVDIAGIIPDLYLAKTENPEAERLEVMRVKNWIEGGSLTDKKE